MAQQNTFNADATRELIVIDLLGRQHKVNKEKSDEPNNTLDL
jgi:hypothetical protein